MGQVNLNTVLGALGTAGFAGVNLRNFVGNLLGSGQCNGIGLGEIVSMIIAMLSAGSASGHHSEHHISRYEMSLEKQIAEKDTKIALLEANTFTDGKTLELYKYIDGKLEGINAVLAKMAVENQRTADTIVMTQNEFRAGLREEAEKRCCADNSIVNYLNNNFYAKEVADVTVGATTTAQTTYNPLPKCNCF